MNSAIPGAKRMPFTENYTSSLSYPSYMLAYVFLQGYTRVIFRVNTFAGLSAAPSLSPAQCRAETFPGAPGLMTSPSFIHVRLDRGTVRAEKCRLPSVCFRFLDESSCTVPSPAQVTTGNLSGRLRFFRSDHSGAAITAPQSTPATPVQPKTGSDGSYLLPDLPIGNYSVMPPPLGFSTINQGVSLGVGKRIRLDLHLAVGAEPDGAGQCTDSERCSRDDASISTLVTRDTIPALRSLCATGTICCARFPAFRSAATPSRAAPPLPAARATSTSTASTRCRTTSSSTASTTTHFQRTCRSSAPSPPTLRSIRSRSST